MPETINAISVNNVTLSYGKDTAVHHANLDVKQNEFFGLIGLNGAGKTTLIKAMLTLKNVQEGEIRLFGQAVNDPDARRRMAFLPERFEPSWFLSGLEFLKFSAKLYNVSLSTAQCEEAAQSVALDPSVLSRQVQTYSKGMRQKLGLIATVLTGCDLLIFDEPMSGLDPMARALVKKFLLSAKAGGATIFISSHILADMEEVCDRVAVLYDGTIQYQGAPAEYKAKMKGENLEKAFLHFIEKSAAA